MSFMKPKDIIEENDTVILYLSVNSMHAIQAKPTLLNKNGETNEFIFQTLYGALRVRHIIGLRFGSRVQLSKGWAYILQPNPEMWTLTLPHRTQIIYTPDISMIVFQLEVRPGSVVIESGTGSGSLSHHFIRAVKPYGHLHTFEFHEARELQAREEFRRHGLSSFATVYHRDVIQDGFSPELDGLADVVFLDLPAPQLAILHAVKALKSSGGRFCSFSPCIEQSQRCCVVLESYGFTNIISMEILQQEHVVKSKQFTIMDMQFLKEKRETATTEAANEKYSTIMERKPKENKKIITTMSLAGSPGHTGFLTFATFPPTY